MKAIIFIAVGMILGILLDKWSVRKNRVGILRVDHSDPTDQPYIFLEATESVYEIAKRKYVLMDVEIRNYISRV